jgi:hypothetical protein
MTGPRRHRRALAVTVALVSLVAVGCSTQRPLPVTRFPDVCRGVGLEATLAGSPSDARVTWLLHGGGAETPLVWPRGWSARFSPSLEVLDEQGRVRLRGGDRIGGGCLKGPPGDPGSVMMVEGLAGS